MFPCKIPNYAINIVKNEFRVQSFHEYMLAFEIFYKSYVRYW